MATDGPDPTPCDAAIFAGGTQVFVTDSIPSNAMERWVRAVAALSGQRVDWHFAGGRACVLAIGDLVLVHSAIEDLRHVHDRWRQRAVDEIFGRCRIQTR